MSFAPTFLNLSGDTLLYTEGDGPIVIEQGDDALVADIDSPDFNGGSLTVSITAGGETTEDVLSVIDSGTPGAGIELIGASLSYNGNDIGTLSGGTGGAPLVIDLLAAADAPAVSALIRAITYENTSTLTPTPGNRTVSFVLNDGDGGVSSAADTTVTVFDLIPHVFETRVSATSDDAEERLSDGQVNRTSSDLEMTLEKAEQLVGIRFNGVEVPQGAVITKAYVQFQTDETSGGAASLTIHGEATDNALAFDNSSGDISARATTAASAAWSPADWTTVGEAGPDQQTADIAAVIQEIVDRTGWASGNSLALMISGSGKRVAESYNGVQSAAPLLHIEYALPDDGLPVVDLDENDSSGAAGNDFTTAYFSGGAPTPIADTDVVIADSNDTTLASAMVTIDNPEAGDTLAAGSLPPGISIDASSTATTLILTGPASLAEYGAAIAGVTFSNTGPGPVEGDRTISVTVNDGTSTSTPATATVTVWATAPPTVFETRVSSTSDDAEERLSDGLVNLTSSDLEMTLEKAEQLVGIRFNGVEVPQGAVITKAYIQFQTDETSSGAAALTIHGEDTDNALAFDNASGDISARATTTASAAWNPADWTTVGEAGPDQQTADIAAVIQEIVDRTGWASGNSLALMISGSGKRVAESYNGVQSAAPLLHIEYTVIEDGTPTVDLDADNSGGTAGNGFATTFIVGNAPVSIADTDVAIADSDGTTLASAMVTIANPEAGDALAAGSLPSGISVDATSTATTLILTGTATLAEYGAAIAGVTFSNTGPGPVEGDRTVSVTVNDGTNTSTPATATITVAATAPPTVFETRVSATSDDAEERLSDGLMDLTSSDLEMTLEDAEQLVGIRFNGIEIPQGAVITKAYLQFQTDETSSGAATLTIHGEDTDNALAFSSTTGDISARATTTASAAWSPADWTIVGEAGPDQQTADIAVVIQEIVDRAGWASGNSLALVISGSGKRVAESYNGVQSAAPLLHIEYVTNASPAIANLSGDTLAYTEGDGAVVIDQGGDALVTDADSPNFAGGALTVSVTAGGDTTEDVLSVRDSGTPGVGIEVAGATIRHDGVDIGTLSGGSGGTPLVIAFIAAANAAAVTALVQAVTYANSDTVSPTTGARTVSFVVTDGDGGTSTAANATVSVTGISAAPVIANLSGDNLAYTEGDGAVVIDQGGDALVTDADSPNFAGGALTVSITAGGDTAEDVLSIRDSGTPGVGIEVVGAIIRHDGVNIGTLSGGSGGAPLVVALNADADEAAATALVRAVTYANTDTASPTEGARTVRFELSNGDGGTSSAADASVTVAATNDDPTIANVSGDTLAYTEGDGAVFIDQGADALVTDADSSDFAGGALTVSITAGGVTAEDVLSVRDSGIPGTGIEVAGATVRYNGTDIGTLSGGTAGAPLVLSLNAAADATAVTALARAIAYENVDTVTPTPGARTASFVLTDGDGGTSASANVTIDVAAINFAPVLANLSGDSLAYAEGDGAVVIDQGGDALVTDADSPDFAGGALTVSITAGGVIAEDVLSIRDSGTPGAGIEVAGSTVRYDGTDIGAVSGGSGGTPLIVSLNGTADALAATALTRAITYENTDTLTATAGARTVSFLLTDGDGGTSASADATVMVSAISSPPTIANLSGDVLSYTEDDGAVVIDQGGDALVNDMDSPDFAGGALTVSIGSGGAAAEDVLAIRDSGTPGVGIEVAGATVRHNGIDIGTLSGGSGGAALTVALNAAADEAAVTALVRAITYENTDAVTPTPGARGVRFVLTDGDGGTSASANATVTVVAANDPPGIFNLSGDVLSYSLGAGVSVIDQNGDALITDPDSADFAGGVLTVSVGAGGVPAEDILSVRDSGTPGSGIEVSGATVRYNGTDIGTLSGGAGGVALMISLLAAADAAAVTALTRAVTYENADAVTPTPGNRTVSFVLTDGDGGTSATVDATVSVLASNAAPTISNLSGDTLAYAEGAGAVILDQGDNALVADVDSTDFDSGTLTVAVGAGGVAAEDVLSIRGSGTPGAGIEIIGATVRHDGVDIGTFAGGANGTDLVVTLNANADAAAVTALTRAIAYENSDAATPTPGDRTVSFVLTDGDGGTSAAANVTVTVSDLIPVSLDVRVSASSDDAEEYVTSGAIDLTSTDLELILEKAEQVVGIRFNGIEIPKGAIITSAYVQFQTDETSSGVASLTIRGEDVDNAETYTSGTNDISSRPTTAASTLWTPADWGTVGASGADQQTTDIAAVIQEIVDRDGWVSGNSLALVISGSGKRVAESYDGVQSAAPLLHIEYNVVDDGVPVVDLDADNSSGTAGNGFATTFYNGELPVPIADADLVISDSNDTSLASATVTVVNPELGDTLTAGSLPGGIVIGAGSTATTLTLTGAASLADYGAALSDITFGNTEISPVEGDRTIEVTVNDGTNTSVPATSTVTVTPMPVLEFWAIADTPYGGSEFTTVGDYLSSIPPNVDFVIHLGDIKGASPSTVDPAYYTSVADLLKTSSVPVFIVLGDNEYNDMDDPDLAFATWEANFDFFDQNWAHSITVNHQAERDENFSFLLDGHLFIGIDHVGGRVHDVQEFTDRAADNLAWVQSNLAQYGDVATSTVIFAQAAPGYVSEYQIFEDGLIAEAQAFGKPMLYLQGDTHVWLADNPYPEAPNLTRVIVDRTGDSSSADSAPMLVSMFDNPDDPFAVDHDFDPFVV